MTPSVLREKQVEVARHYSRGLPQKDVKLLPSLPNKVNYVTHYLNLKFYIEHGLNLTKIHRVIQFQQSRWLQPYIAKNTNLRAAAKSAMEKEFFKLRHSSSYGKTCENHAKHNDIRLLTETGVFQKLYGKPQCQGIRIFNVHLVGLYLKKVRIRINKPFYVGFAVMELSKLHMFKYGAYFIISICQ